MPYQSSANNPGRMVGIGFVIVLHIGIVYALVTGLAREAMHVVTGPIETKIIEEIKPEREPPPPPPPPKFKTPPPPFVPPPEITIETPPPPQQVLANATTTRPPDPAPPPRAAPAPAGPTVGAKPDAKSFTRPEYPAMSVRLGEEGSVIVNLYCSENGRVTDAQVETSSGFSRLDEATVKEAKRGRWKCTAAQENGAPVGSWFKFKYTWRLQDAR
ncbi:MAG TPA: energy transducer TonB [Azospirillaceae bacterium]|nr:energy transducer TonB [Azospirillaceae bacterium]